MLLLLLLPLLMLHANPQCGASSSIRSACCDVHQHVQRRIMRMQLLLLSLLLSLLLLPLLLLLLLLSPLLLLPRLPPSSRF